MAVKEFYLDEYIQELRRQDKKEIRDSQENKRIFKVHEHNEFLNVCELANSHMAREFSSDGDEKILDYNKKAMMGEDKEKAFFLDKIKSFLTEYKLENTQYPSWYSSLAEAIFQEVWGYHAAAEWLTMDNSQSAKIIGTRVFYASPITGQMELMPQTITKERLEQLIKVLMFKSPEQRLDKGNATVYLKDGSRITIFTNKLTKEHTVIFRKYIVKRYTFEEQADRGTIPRDFIPALEDMVRMGFNVGFVGSPKTAKTTFLTSWQSYEDKDLEGIQVETDPEIPLHIISPEAPLIQFVANKDRLGEIVEFIKRSDADYVIAAEAREVISLKLVTDIMRIGVRRCKFTYHQDDPMLFFYDAATDIVNEYGGDVFATALNIAKSIDYMFEFIQLRNKSQKRLNAIYEMCFNHKTLEVTAHKILSYNHQADDWTYYYHFGGDKENIGIFEDERAMNHFKETLKQLSDKYPSPEPGDFVPFINKFIQMRR